MAMAIPPWMHALLSVCGLAYSNSLPAQKDGWPVSVDAAGAVEYQGCDLSFGLDSIPRDEKMQAHFRAVRTCRISRLPGTIAPSI
jgi:hypothetical protein